MSAPGYRCILPCLAPCLVLIAAVSLCEAGHFIQNSTEDLMQFPQNIQTGAMNTKCSVYGTGQNS